MNMRVEARDGQKAWKMGVVTCVNPLKVKVDGELSGVSWDEVRPYDEAKAAEETLKKNAGAVNSIMQKIAEDAAAMVKQAKEAALADVNFAVGGVRELATKENVKPEDLKAARARVAVAIKAAQAKGVSQEELVEASKGMGKAPEEKAEGKGEERIKKKAVVIEFDNPAVGEAAKEAAAAAKEEGKTLPEIIKAAVDAAQAVEGASTEDVKKAKKAAAAAAMEESSDSSDSSDSTDTEVENDIGETEKQKAKREGIAAAFYFNAK